MKITESMQHEAKALSDPSRFQLFRYIAESNGPVGVSELTDLLGFNHNAIRQHLAILVEAKVITESNESNRGVRGRPRKQYRVRDDALASFGSVSGSYQRLAELLLQVVQSGDAPFDVGFRAGISDAAEIEDADGAEEALLHELRVGGFDPVVTTPYTVELASCPYADLAVKDSAVTCELHRGLIQGHLAARGGAINVSLEPRDPRTSTCLVQVGP